MIATELKAPFPYFGGKSTVADVVWRHFGDADKYIEPFFGSGAVLLRRPDPRGIEVVNDKCAFLANFWRAVKAEPEAVAGYCNWPINEADLEARHKWLVTAARKREHQARMRDEPDYFDSKIAGYWCWGLCQWIGRDWCGGEWHGRDHEKTNGTGINTKSGKKPFISCGLGVHRQRPRLGGQPGTFRRPPKSIALGESGRKRFNAETKRLAWLIEWFKALRDRLITVKVCCGDWRRVCDSRATVLSHATQTAVFFDPPYSAEAGRDDAIYNEEDSSIAHDVREWCLKWGGNPRVKIALCGYAGEGHEALDAAGWWCYKWKAHGGMGNRNADYSNNEKERIWFSPACKPAGSLFP